ncbi:hypothetical protein N1851_026938 [Merluccius polli]|uniref:Uncharacterized protein n=1 Tax=Merluccius polli TaxID=89951 RepID=A0AA47MB97_MERPO|nr:hypothetical protein N1851_026938 [Merluccius polli]
MISRFLEQQQAVCGVLAGDRSTWHLMPKDNDITVLEELSQLLCPLHEFTDVLASERREHAYVPTALCSHSHIFPQPYVPTFLSFFQN